MGRGQEGGQTQEKVFHLDSWMGQVEEQNFYLYRHEAGDSRRTGGGLSVWLKALSLVITLDA